MIELKNLQGYTSHYNQIPKSLLVPIYHEDTFGVEFSFVLTGNYNKEFTIICYNNGRKQVLFHVTIIKPGGDRSDGCAACDYVLVVFGQHHRRGKTSIAPAPDAYALRVDEGVFCL